MGMGVKVRVWGDYALFSRPEMKVERCSYDVITPSAARGILEAIYWHPGMKWCIDKIYVKKPVKFTSVRRNEVKSKVSASKVLEAYNGGMKPLYLSSKEEIVQRASLLLSDVEYVIEAHFEMTEKANETDNPGKFKDIIMRRLKRGACYSMPYFGCREFPANFELCNEEEIHTAYDDVEEKDFGFMLYDIDYSDEENLSPMFFRAIMKAQLRGFEGEAASVYFGVFDEMILQQKKDFSFQGRNKRPPLDNMNAMLSFVYTLLTNTIASSLECVGLDPYVGYLHTERPGRVSLALDMIEELRAVLADRFVLSLVNKKIVNGKNFTKKENGAVLMDDELRKKLLVEWQKKKKETITHPFLKEKVEWGMVPYVQAMLLARYLRGDLDSYPVFLWK